MYPPPSNIQLFTYNEGMQSIRLDILWDTVMPYSSWNNTRDKFTYYIQLVHLESLPDSDFLIVRDYFKVTSSGRGSQLSVSLFPLDVNASDI